MSKARRRNAGGGAGIIFEMTDVGARPETKLAVVDHDRKVYDIPTVWSAVVFKFDAEGYMDGGRDFDGRKVFTNAEVELDQREVEAVSRELYEEVYEWHAWDAGEAREPERFMEEEIEVALADIELVRYVMFRGYVRGKIEEGDFLQMEGTALVAPVDYHGGDEVDCVFSADFTKKGEYWYEDVFEFDPEDESELEFHGEDVMEEYGAG